MLKLQGRDSFVKVADGTFSLTKWKALVARYQSVNIAPYIADGTIIGHYLIDEPHIAHRWGGKIISQATLEAMAQYSKLLLAHNDDLRPVVPSWPRGRTDHSQPPDAGWRFSTRRAEGMSPPSARPEVAAAKKASIWSSVSWWNEWFSPGAMVPAGSAMGVSGGT